MLVNCPEEELRRNRLALLASIQKEFSRIADFSEIVVEKENETVFFFGNGRAEGAGLGKERLGGKGSGLAEMTALGIPVPPGFTIDTAGQRGILEGVEPRRREAGGR